MVGVLAAADHGRGGASMRVLQLVWMRKDYEVTAKPPQKERGSWRNHASAGVLAFFFFDNWLFFTISCIPTSPTMKSENKSTKSADEMVSVFVLPTSEKMRSMSAACGRACSQFYARSTEKMG